MNSCSISSIDLIQEILSRLPAKSITRFRCVSKLWASMFVSPYFTELFLTRSSAKPRLLFAIEEDYVWSFFSTPQLQNPYEKSSSSTLVAAAEFHVKFSPGKVWIHHDRDLKYFSYGYASGLIYLWGCRYQGRPVICNPNTGRYVVLPFLWSYRKGHSFFGFEPIDKQYKALFMRYPFGPGRYKVLTLGTKDMMSWRRIKCSIRHEIMSEGVCINGVLYYLGDTSDCSQINPDDVTSDFVIVCFDLRSEKFTFIDVDRFCRLINYKGKLAVIYWEDDVEIHNTYLQEDVEDDYVDIYDNDVEEDVEKDVEDDDDADAVYELHVRVLEDVEKQEWSEYLYRSDDKFFHGHVTVVGATDRGEIVFSMRKYTPKQPFYVFYFNPERSTLRRVEIQGFGEGFKKPCGVCTFVNHVEDLNVNDLEPLKSFHDPSDELAGEYESDSD